MAVGSVVVDCLDGDAEITMGDRRKKKIKNIKAGDKILTYNKSKLKIKTVREVKTGSSDSVQAITLRSGAGNTFSIKATGGHPFFTAANTWSVLDPTKFAQEGCPAKLKEGDSLVLSTSGVAEIIKINSKPEKLATYNLIIDGPGTFFVNDVLSHSGLAP